MEETSIRTMCRTCLTEEGEFQSVFVGDESSGTAIHLSEMIMAYSSVQITLGDGLPELICSSCAKKAVSLYQFKLKCEESDGVLRQRLSLPSLNKLVSIQEERSVENLTNNTGTIEDSTNDKKDIVINSQFAVKPEVNLVHNDNSSLESDEEAIQSENGSLDLRQVSCDICHKQFSGTCNLSRHKRKHELTKQFKCEFCDKCFSRNYVLVRHLLSHAPRLESDGHSLQINEIKIEDQPPSLQTLLADNTVMENLIEVKTEEDEDVKFLMGDEFNFNSGETKLKCKECNKEFVKAVHLSRHLKIHASVKPYVCELCSKGFVRLEQYNNHKNSHSGVKPHVCEICNKGFNQVSNLKDHMRTHNGEKPFLCSVCGKGFNQLGNLRQHTIRHSGIKAHLCSTCGNGFASKGELCAHLRKHTGVRPFVCNICNHGFTTSSSLTKHKRIHSGEKPYECDVCKMKFSRSGILARHKRTHTGEKPYACKFCTKAFSQSNDLSSHLRIHTGEKPYVCDTCGQAFRQSSALKTHKKTHIDRSEMVVKVERPANFVSVMHNTYLNIIQ